MNAIYFSMKGTSQKVTLPLELDMESKGCSLFDISGTVKPYIEPPIYLCANFVGNSIVVGSDHPTEKSMQLSVLHQINLKKTNDNNLAGNRSKLQQDSVVTDQLQPRRGDTSVFKQLKWESSHIQALQHHQNTCVHSTQQIFKMVSVEKWKEHFCRQAHRTFPKEEMYIVNQTGHGLGRKAYSRQAMYKVQHTSGSPNPSVEMVSPIA